MLVVVPYLRAIRVLAWSTVIKVGAPFPIERTLNVVTLWVFRQGLHSHGSPEQILGVHIHDVPHVAGLGESLLRKLAAAHRGGRMVALGLRVHHLTSPLQHRRTRGEMGEKGGRPVTHQVPVPKLHPPVALDGIFPNKDANIVLRTSRT